MKKIRLKAVLGSSLVIAALSLSVKASEEKKVLSKVIKENLLGKSKKIEIKDKTSNLKSMSDGTKTESTGM